MFGDMLGDMQKRQEEMKQKLAEIEVHAEAGDGAVKVTATANREITNIALDPNQLGTSDLEQIEDLMMVAVNRALELAAEKEAEESQNLIKGILPPGMDGLFG